MHLVGYDGAAREAPYIFTALLYNCSAVWVLKTVSFRRILAPLAIMASQFAPPPLGLHLHILPSIVFP